MRRLASALAIVLAVTTAASSPVLAISQAAFQRIAQQTWRGSSVQRADFTTTGKAYLSHDLTVRLGAGERFTANWQTNFRLDGIDYRRTAEVYGRASASGEYLVIEGMRSLRSDRLPSGLEWCRATGTLKFYNNADRAGGHILKGTLHDSCGGSSDIELVDR